MFLYKLKNGNILKWEHDVGLAALNKFLLNYHNISMTTQRQDVSHETYTKFRLIINKTISRI